MSDPWMAAFLGHISGGDLGFGGVNVNVTNQVQAAPTIIGHADGDVSVTNVQTNATGQDVSGAGHSLGDHGDAGGINLNLTNQIQADPTIVGHADGNVSVTNFQGNGTDQSVHGTGIGHDIGGDLFNGINVNVTNQIQADPTIIGHADGNVSVTNFQGNGTDQSVHGTGIGHDFGLGGHDLGFF